MQFYNCIASPNPPYNSMGCYGYLIPINPNITYSVALSIDESKILPQYVGMYYDPVTRTYNALPTDSLDYSVGFSDYGDTLKDIIFISFPYIIFIALLIAAVVITKKVLNQAKK